MTDPLRGFEELAKELDRMLRHLRATNHPEAIYLTNAISDLRALITAARTEIRQGMRDMTKAAMAYRDLSTCYRIGKAPSEELWKHLDEATPVLAKGIAELQAEAARRNP